MFSGHERFSVRDGSLFAIHMAYKNGLKILVVINLIELNWIENGLAKFEGSRRNRNQDVQKSEQ